MEDSADSVESTPRGRLLTGENYTSNRGRDDSIEIDSRGGLFRLGALKYYCRFHMVLEFLASISILLLDLFFRKANPDPRQRELPYQVLDSTGEYMVNQSFNDEFVGETISSLELYIYGAFLPFACQLILSSFYGILGVHKTTCVYATAIGLTNILTNAIKLYVGYLRPIFYDGCQPDEAYQYCTSGADSSQAVRKSFPSGHSSLAFCGLGLLAFYLEQHFGISKVRERRGESDGVQPVQLERVVSVLSLAPFFFAGFIASSRVVDSKHFPADVVGGSLLGASVASFVHRIWYSYDHHTR